MMRLNAPKKGVWFLSLILAILSIVAYFVVIPVVSGITFWVMVAAWLLLFLATYLKGF
jgi:polyferredoxin